MQMRKSMNRYQTYKGQPLTDATLFGFVRLEQKMAAGLTELERHNLNKGGWVWLARNSNAAEANDGEE